MCLYFYISCCSTFKKNYFYRILEDIFAKSMLFYLLSLPLLKMCERSWSSQTLQYWASSLVSRFNEKYQRRSIGGREGERPPSRSSPPHILLPPRSPPPFRKFWKTTPLAVLLLETNLRPLGILETITPPRKSHTTPLIVLLHNIGSGSNTVFQGNNKRTFLQTVFYGFLWPL